MASAGRSSVLAGFRFLRKGPRPRSAGYLRYGLPYRDVEELLAGHRITVDHVMVYRWVQRCTPEFIETARLSRRAPGSPVVPR